MNLAILIGVSEYSNEKISELTACRNDANLINLLLKSTKKYDEILLIEKDTTSDNVKKQLTDFIKKHSANEEKEIEELFFYYSGHGQFHNEEFYYILSDFDFDRRNSTSLNNSELDNLLRNLSPNLTIKFIDACQSGVSYVKEPGEFKIDKIINNGKQTFQNCYFMFSSHSTQSSKATDKISFFTYSFLKAIFQSINGDIRYADLINRIKDDFAQPSSTQTPYFITQADYTEVFCNVTDAIKKIVSDGLSTLADAATKSEKNNSSMTLLEIIEKEAEDYCSSPEEAYELLKKAREVLYSYNFCEDLMGLYNITITDSTSTSYHNLPKINTIGAQLSKEEDYFIDIRYGIENVKEEIQISPILKASSMIYGNEPEKKYRTVARRYISDIIVTEKSPLYQINFDLKPKFPNVPGFNTTLATAFSKKELTIFFFYNKCKELGWGEFVKNDGNVIWEYSKLQLKKIEETKEKEKIGKILEGFERYILDILTEQYKLKTNENNSNKEETNVPVITSNKEMKEVRKN
jgi:hypothetical protein